MPRLKAVNPESAKGKTKRLLDGGGTTNIFHVNATGADKEAIRRLERLVADVNGSIELRAVTAITRSASRGEAAALTPRAIL